LVGNTEPPVLLVEDNPDDVLITKRAWEKGSISNTLIDLSDGEQALKFLRKQGKYSDVPTPCLILLDLKMPRVDGFAVLETMKSDNSLKNIPVLILTSSEREQDIERANKLGCEKYIVKPVSFEGFLKEVAEIKSLLLSIKERAHSTLQTSGIRGSI